jgi:large-conductance mechanosensitive channel
LEQKKKMPKSKDSLVQPPSSVLKWLRDEKVLAIVVGVMIGDAISRLLANLMEEIARPVIRGVLREDPDDPSFVRFGAIKVQPRAFLVAFFEFAIIVVIAYLLMRKANKS